MELAPVVAGPVGILIGWALGRLDRFFDHKAEQGRWAKTQRADAYAAVLAGERRVVAIAIAINNLLRFASEKLDRTAEALAADEGEQLGVTAARAALGSEKFDLPTATHQLTDAVREMDVAISRGLLVARDQPTGAALIALRDAVLDAVHLPMSEDRDERAQRLMAASKEFRHLARIELGLV